VAGRGPAGSSDPVRRNVRAGSGVRLPAEGRQGEPPVWPLRPDVMLTARLDFLRSEQASLEVAIEATEDKKEANRLRYRLGKNVESIAVAESVRAQTADLELELWREAWATPQAVAWEQMRWTREVAQYVRWKAKAELGDMEASKEARMLGDRLGLTPLSLQALRWTIVRDEMAEKRAETPTARGRIKAV
jgi:hypothetical protein